MTWPTKKLGEICRVEKGKKPEVFDTQTSSRFPYLGAKFLRGIKEAKFAEKSDGNSVFITEKDLVIICDGSKSGDLFSGFEGILSSTMGKIVFDEHQIEKKYLELFLQHNFQFFNSGKKGAAIPHLDFHAFNSLEISLPLLVEQKKTVARLEKLLAKVKEAKRLRTEARTAVQTLLSAELHKIFKEGKKKGWKEKIVNGIADAVQYGYTASARDRGNSRLLRITDIQDGAVNWDAVPFCECGDLEKYRLHDGDIVFARTGATVGKSYLINNPPENAIFASYLIRVSMNRKQCSPELLYYFFQSLDYWDQVTEHAVGGAQPNVNGSKLKQIKISLPPFTEQKKIVARLDALSAKLKKLEEYQKSAALDLARLEQSILHKAFSN